MGLCLGVAFFWTTVWFMGCATQQSHTGAGGDNTGCESLAAERQALPGTGHHAKETADGRTVTVQQEGIQGLGGNRDPSGRIIIYLERVDPSGSRGAGDDGPGAGVNPPLKDKNPSTKSG